MLSLLNRSRKGWKACMLIVMGETKSFKTLLFSLFSSDSSSSAVTHTIISCCIRSRSRRPFLESKSIASTVCRCPVSSFSFSSEPNFLKNELTVAQSPSCNRLNPAHEPENSKKLGRGPLLFLSSFTSKLPGAPDGTLEKNSVFSSGI